MTKELVAKGCVDCGCRDIRVLDFDHVEGQKIKGVGRVAYSASSDQALIEEMSKCQVRCANCHRIATAIRGNFWTQKEWVRLNSETHVEGAIEPGCSQNNALAQ